MRNPTSKRRFSAARAPRPDDSTGTGNQREKRRATQNVLCLATAVAKLPVACCFDTLPTTTDGSAESLSPNAPLLGRATSKPAATACYTAICPRSVAGSKPYTAAKR